MSSLLRRYKISKLTNNVLSSDEEELCDLLLNNISNCIPEYFSHIRIFYRYNEICIFEYYFNKKVVYFYLEDDVSCFSTKTYNKIVELTENLNVSSHTIIAEWLEEIYNIKIETLYIV